MRSNMRQYTMIAALLLIWIIFTFLTQGVFLTPRNLSNLFLQMVTIGILTGGMLLVMVAGHIDLSVGAVCGTLGAVVAYLMSKMNVHPALAVLITVALGALVGLWNGFWIAYQGVPAFIVTLASQITFKGLTLAITGGKTIGEFPASFKEIGQGYIPRLFFQDEAFHDLSVAICAVAILAFLFMEFRKRGKRVANGFSVLPWSLEIMKVIIICASVGALGYVFGSYRGISYAMVILAIVVGIYTVLTTRTPFGRHVYAIGGNKEAARLSGVNIRKTMLAIFLSMGTLSGVASVVFTARLNAATTAAGNLFELDTIAACIIGGTSTTGGIGTVFGALIGALVMASLNNGMELMNLHVMYQYMVKGLVLLIAVWIDIANRKK
ncbi:MAG: sugar ABC transporter permease [Clostridia bacterium]|nr:sugar ABC transporter permease [Clostridia bacterium]